MPAGRSRQPTASRRAPACDARAPARSRRDGRRHAVLRPSCGLSPSLHEQLIGTVLTRPIEAGARSATTFRTSGVKVERLNVLITAACAGAVSPVRAFQAALQIPSWRGRHRDRRQPDVAGGARRRPVAATSRWQRRRITSTPSRDLRCRGHRADRPDHRRRARGVRQASSWFRSRRIAVAVSPEVTSRICTTSSKPAATCVASAFARRRPALRPTFPRFRAFRCSSSRVRRGGVGAADLQPQVRSRSSPSTSTPRSFISTSGVHDRSAVRLREPGDFHRAARTRVAIRRHRSWLHGARRAR